MRIIIVIFLIFFSCKSEQGRAEAPPNIDPIIEEIKKAESPIIESGLKNRVLIALEECKNYSEKSYTDLISANEKILKLKENIKLLESELETWRTIKRYIYILIGLIVSYLILSAIWKYRAIIFKIAGIPL
jgi:hypothetical protein